MTYYSIHWDRSTLITHYSLLVVILVISTALIYSTIRHANVFYLYLGILLFSIVGPTIYLYTYVPKKFVITEDTIEVLKVRGKHVFVKENVFEIKRIDKELLKKSIRTMASGGFFGFWGSFKNKTLGEYKMYGGSFKENLVLIVMNNGKKIVLTPEDPERFVEEAKQ